MCIPELKNLKTNLFYKTYSIISNHRRPELCYSVQPITVARSQHLQPITGARTLHLQRITGVGILHQQPITDEGTLHLQPITVAGILHQ